VTPITIPINFSGNAISVLDLNSISHGDLVTPVTNLVTVVTGDADSTGVLGTVTGAVGGVTASVEGIISGDYNPIDVVTGIVGGVLSGEGGSPLDLVTGLVGGVIGGEGGNPLDIITGTIGGVIGGDGGPLGAVTGITTADAASKTTNDVRD